MGLTRGMAAALARRPRLPHVVTRAAAATASGALCGDRYAEPHRAARRPCRLYSSGPGRGPVAAAASLSPLPKEVAVLGGGLTGLTTAYYLSQFLPPTSRITLYEGSDRLGGWIDSEVTDVTANPVAAVKGVKLPLPGNTKGNKVVLEGGARMVAPQTNLPRYDDLVLLELVDALNLVGDLRVSQIKMDQYIYYPDHIVPVTRPDGPLLQKILASLYLLAEPLFTGLVGAAMRAWFVRRSPKTRAAELSLLQRAFGPNSTSNGLPPDESVGAYFARITGAPSVRDKPAFVDNVISAIMHGVYGGDLDKISIGSSPFRQLWITSTLRRPVNEAILFQAGLDSTLPLDQQAAASARILDPAKVRRNPNDTVFMMYNDYGLLTDITERAERRSRSSSGSVAAHKKNAAGGKSTSSGEGSNATTATPKTGEIPRDADVLEVNRFVRLASASQGWTQMGFAGGFGTLTNRLRDRLSAMPNVTIRTGQRVTKVRQAAAAAPRESKQAPKTGAAAAAANGSPKLEVVVAPKTPGTGKASFKAYDKVISTLTGRALYDLTTSTRSSPDSTAKGKPVADAALPSLRKDHAVTIQVVNLYYADHAGLNHPFNGFGYLIPRTVPFEQNPESALGVLFDTDRELSLRPVHEFELAAKHPHIQTLMEGGFSYEDAKAVCEQTVLDTVPALQEELVKSAGTKFTVMLGGYYWDGAGEDGGSSSSEAEDALYPTPEEAVAMAESVIRRHLVSPTTGEPLIPAGLRPTATRTKLCRACIPQHYVGHARKLATTDAELASAFGGRLAVAGGSFTPTGPGVLPSLRSARDVAMRVANRGYLTRQPPAPGQDGVGRVTETALNFVGETGLARFSDQTTEALRPTLKTSLALRFGTRTVYDQRARCWGTVDKA